jgi:hypothetical protein
LEVAKPQQTMRLDNAGSLCQRGGSRGPRRVNLPPSQCLETLAQLHLPNHVAELSNTHNERRICPDSIGRQGPAIAGTDQHSPTNRLERSGCHIADRRQCYKTCCR